MKSHIFLGSHVKKFLKFNNASKNVNECVEGKKRSHQLYLLVHQRQVVFGITEMSCYKATHMADSEQTVVSTKAGNNYLRKEKTNHIHIVESTYGQHTYSTKLVSNHFLLPD